MKNTAESTLSGFRLKDPNTGRSVYFSGNSLPDILALLPENMSAALRSDHLVPDDLPGPAILALLAARKNRKTLSRNTNSDPSRMTLVKTGRDPFRGYYYPEKGKNAWFKAHGEISVDPNQVDPMTSPGELSKYVDQEQKAHQDHPFTYFTVIRHGTFVYLIQAKRLNGRKRIFGKLIHDGKRPVTMTHWARVTGRDSGFLIRKAGIDTGLLNRAATA